MISRLMRYLAIPAIFLLGTNTAFAASDCDRACLRTVLDQHINTVIKHDGASAPLFVGFRQTEDAVVVKPGNGVWKTVTALGKVQRKYFDAVTGQAGYFGLIDESGTPAIATLRLKVEDRKITEAEWVIPRKSDVELNGGTNGQFDPDTLIANPPPERTPPRESRISCEAMVAATNSYFDGISAHDGSIIQAIPGCSRFENGIAVTGRGGGARGGGAAAPAAVSDGTSGLGTINILFVAARRYPLVDEEAGVVLGMMISQRNPGTTTRRNLLSEWFHLENNRIKTIYASMFYPPPEAPAPKWPPFEPNWSIQLPPSPAAGQR